MTPLASMGLLFCLILLVGFGVSILPAMRADAHLLHKPGTCTDTAPSTSRERSIAGTGRRRHEPVLLR